MVKWSANISHFLLRASVAPTNTFLSIYHRALQCPITSPRAGPMVCPSLSLELPAQSTPMLGHSTKRVHIERMVDLLLPPTAQYSLSLLVVTIPCSLQHTRSRWDHPSTRTPSTCQWRNGSIDLRHADQTLDQSDRKREKSWGQFIPTPAPWSDFSLIPET